MKKFISFVVMAAMLIFSVPAYAATGQCSLSGNQYTFINETITFLVTGVADRPDVTVGDSRIASVGYSNSSGTGYYFIAKGLAAGSTGIYLDGNLLFTLNVQNLSSLNCNLSGTINMTELESKRFFVKADKAPTVTTGNPEIAYVSLQNQSGNIYNYLVGTSICDGEVGIYINGTRAFIVNNTPFVDNTVAEQDHTKIKAQMLRIANETRAEKGISPLTEVSGLDEMADERAKVQYDRGRGVSSYTDDPLTLVLLAQAHGVTCHEMDEPGAPLDISNDGNGAMALWRDSDEIWKCFLNEKFTRVGFGIYDDGQSSRYFTAELADDDS